MIFFSSSHSYRGTARFPAQIGLVKIKDTAYVNNILSNEKFQTFIPGTLKFAYGKYSGNPTDTGALALYALKINHQEPNPFPTGDQISNVRIMDVKDGEAKKPVIGFEFNQGGTRAWSYMTRKNVTWPVAVCANDMVLTAPLVEGPIEDGRSRIDGDFTELELWYLVTMMRSGRLALPVRIISSKFSAAK